MTPEEIAKFEAQVMGEWDGDEKPQTFNEQLERYIYYALDQTAMHAARVLLGKFIIDGWCLLESWRHDAEPDSKGVTTIRTCDIITDAYGTLCLAVHINFAHSGTAGSLEPPYVMMESNPESLTEIRNLLDREQWVQSESEVDAVASSAV